MSVEHLISQYGYLALFAGVFLEGETILIAAAFAAHQGYMELRWVILVAFLGSLGGDEFYFFLGRFKGKAFLDKRPLWQVRVKKVQGLMERYHRLIIVGFRFLYGVRTVTPFALGMSNVKTPHFVIFNIIGAFTWTVCIAVLGYLFSTALEALLLDVRKYERVIMGGIMAAGTLGYAIYFLRRRRLRRMAAAELARQKAARKNGRVEHDDPKPTEHESL